MVNTLELNCVKCGKKIEIFLSCLEAYVYSDPHDPDNDYIRCPYCEGLTDLSIKTKAKLNGCEGKVFSDTCRVFWDSDAPANLPKLTNDDGKEVYVLL